MTYSMLRGRCNTLSNHKFIDSTRSAAAINASPTACLRHTERSRSVASILSVRHLPISDIKRQSNVAIMKSYPVENRGIGQTATYVTPTKSKSPRYKLSDRNFESQNATNYATLRGTVKGINASPNHSGDSVLLYRLLQRSIPQPFLNTMSPASILTPRS